MYGVWAMGSDMDCMFRQGPVPLVAPVKLLKSAKQSEVA